MEKRYSTLLTYLFTKFKLITYSVIITILYVLQNKNFLSKIFPEEMNNIWEDLKLSTNRKASRYKSLDTTASKKLLEDLSKNPAKAKSRINYRALTR